MVLRPEPRRPVVTPTCRYRCVVKGIHGCAVRTGERDVDGGAKHPLLDPEIRFAFLTAGRRVPRADGTVYAATKHALTAVAEGLRIDVHTKGIRVIKVEPGLVRMEFPESSYPSAREYYAQREYSPLEAEDIAEAVLYAVEQPPRVSVNEILLRPTEQPK